MKENSKYPMLEIDLTKLKHNIDSITSICEKSNIKVAGVVKGFNAIPSMLEVYAKSKCSSLASSRIEQLIECKKINQNMPTMMIRLPMLSEIELLVRYADSSLNSEVIILEALEKECKRQKKIHNVILMVDVGDLREGIFDTETVIEIALNIEKNMSCLHLLGLGINLGCYGAIEATVEKMNELISVAELVETAISRKLEVLSGGNTTSMPLVFNGSMPNRINHLRIGEGLCLTYDYGKFFGIDSSFLHQDVLVLKAEVIEIKDKPSYPIGTIGHNGFGHYPSYIDRGIRRRALLAVGKVDFGEVEMIFPKNEKIEIVGASSDHLIIDIENSKNEIKIGDILNFELTYLSMVYASGSRNVKKSILEYFKG